MALRSTERIGALVDRQTVFIAPTARMCDVAHRLWWQGVGVVVVGTADRPLGVVSERDVVGLLATNADPDATAVDVIRRPMISVGAETPIQDAARVMLDNAVRHLPVTDEAGRVVGVVSIRDVIGTLLVEHIGA